MPASQTVSLVDSLRQLTNAFADPDIQSYIGKYVAGFVALILTSAVIYKAANDQDAMNDKFFTYMLFAVIPACFGLALVLRASNSKLTPSNGIFYTIVFLLFLWGVTSVYKMRNPSSVKTLSALLSVVGVLAIVVGLAIGYRLIHRIVVNMRGWTGLFFKILFIIPCFVIDFLESLSADLKSTPKMVLVLLALEALLLVVYYRLPQWVGKHVMGVSPDEEVVLPNPMFLSTKVVVAPTLPPSPSPLDPESEVAKANFAVSFWAYVNDQPQTQAAAYARESNIFRYGHPTAVQSSHPRLTYNSKASGKTPWAVYLSDTDTPHATLNLPNQAWNHFVFNYQGNEVDVFVNGNLVKSVQLSDPPRIDKTDVFVLGDGDNSVWGGGLHGAISNVVYHFNALTQNAIAAAYIWKKHSNPPTSGNT